jgi:PAS domain S-box-containing protein
MDVLGGLQNHEFLPELLLEELPDIAAFLIDLELRVTTWSPGVERILGYSQSEFLGLHASVLFTPEDRKQKVDQREFENARVNGRASDMRWHMKRDGARTFVDGVLRAVSDGNGGHVGYVKIMRDISPNRVAHSMLTAILDRTPDAISLKDREGRFAFVNSELGRLAGRKLEDLVGLTSEDLFPPDISAALRESDMATMQADGHNHRGTHAL